MTPDQYVVSVLSRYTGSSAPVTAAAGAIIPSLNQWAGNYLASPISFSGSYAKGTAILGGTDIDLFISLKPNGPVLNEIYNSLFSFSQGRGWLPRTQNVSIGIAYASRNIDLVPGRQQAVSSDYHSLYRAKTGSWTQTNVVKHMQLVKNSGRLSEIRAIKIWRTLHGLEFPSFYLELTVIEALRGTRTVSLAERVLTVLDYLSTTFLTARVIDPSNTANIISDDLSVAEKNAIARQAKASRQKPNWNQIIW